MQPHLALLASLRPDCMQAVFNGPWANKTAPEPKPPLGLYPLGPPHAASAPSANIIVKFLIIIYASLTDIGHQVSPDCARTAVRVMPEIACWGNSRMQSPATVFKPLSMAFYLPRPNDISRNAGRPATIGGLCAQTLSSTPYNTVPPIDQIRKAHHIVFP